MISTAERTLSWRIHSAEEHSELVKGSEWQNNMPGTRYFNTKRPADFSSLARSCIHPWYWLHLLLLQEQSGQSLLLCCTVPQHSRQHHPAERCRHQLGQPPPCCGQNRCQQDFFIITHVETAPRKYLTSRS